LFAVTTIGPAFGELLGTLVRWDLSRVRSHLWPSDLPLDQGEPPRTAAP